MGICCIHIGCTSEYSGRQSILKERKTRAEQKAANNEIKGK